MCGKQERRTRRNDAHSSLGVAVVLFWRLEQPNNSINTFQGVLRRVRMAGGAPNGGRQIALDGQNLLLRGCVLRNTKWVLGVVCFTGEDTKVARNSQKVRADAGEAKRPSFKALCGARFSSVEAELSTPCDSAMSSLCGPH